MTPELIGILAVGATVIGLMLTFRRDARADLAELRKDVQALTERCLGRTDACLGSKASSKASSPDGIAATTPDRPKSRQGRVVAHELRRAG